MIKVETVADRLTGVRERIERAGGDPSTVRVVAVTKGFGPDAISAAVEAGLTDVGENYAAEMIEKVRLRREAPAGGPEPAWHFLGAIQRRKVPALAPVVDCWQGVARAEEGRTIGRHRPGAAVMVEVDTSELPSRNGVLPDDVAALVQSLSDEGLQVLGLMTVAPPDPDAARGTFRTVRQLADDLGLAERSMGMSDDLELAVAEGATMVRIGRALFGDRPPRAGTGAVASHPDGRSG